MKSYHYTKTRQLWLEKNKFKINCYMREYMRIRRNQNKNNINIQKGTIIIHFNYILFKICKI